MPDEGAEFGPMPSADEVRAELERILASEPFRPSAQLQAFLRFVVEATLKRRGGAHPRLHHRGRGVRPRPGFQPAVRPDRAGRGGAAAPRDRALLCRPGRGRSRSRSSCRAAAMCRASAIADAKRCEAVPRRRATAVRRAAAAPRRSVQRQSRDRRRLAAAARRCALGGTLLMRRRPPRQTASLTGARRAASRRARVRRSRSCWSIRSRRSLPPSRPRLAAIRARLADAHRALRRCRGRGRSRGGRSPAQRARRDRTSTGSASAASAAPTAGRASRCNLTDARTAPWSGRAASRRAAPSDRRRRGGGADRARRSRRRSAQPLRRDLCARAHSRCGVPASTRAIAACSTPSSIAARSIPPRAASMPRSAAASNSTIASDPAFPSAQAALAFVLMREFYARRVARPEGARRGAAASRCAPWSSSPRSARARHVLMNILFARGSVAEALARRRAGDRAQSL